MSTSTASKAPSKNAGFSTFALIEEVDALYYYPPTSYVSVAIYPSSCRTLSSAVIPGYCAISLSPNYCGYSYNSSVD